MEWDKENFQKYRQKAQRAYNLDPSDVNETTIAYYDIMSKLNKDGNRKGKQKYRSVELKEYIKENINEFNDYYSSVPECVANYICEIISCLDVYFSDIYFDDEMLKMNQRMKSGETLKKQSYEFIRDINSNLIPYLDFIYSEGLVNFVENKRSDESCVYPDYHNKVAWGLMHNSEDFFTEAVFNHELMHMLDAMVNPIFDVNCHVFSLSEIGSMFASDLTCHKIITNPNSSDFTKMNAIKGDVNYFRYYKNYIFAQGMLYYLSKMNRLTDSSIKNQLANRYNIIFDDESSEKEFMISIASYVGMNSYASNYIFSNIINLHLMKEYKNDEDKGKYLYTTALTSTSADLVSFFDEIEFDIEDIDYGMELLVKRNAEVNRTYKLLKK